MTKAHKHIPVIVGPLEETRPYDCEMVVVEITKGAIDLPRFVHPERALYVLGPEDGSVPNRITKNAQHIVKVPTAYCMNVAATANVILYDRMAKRLLRTQPHEVK